MQPAEAEISRGRGFNPVWIIPLVALLLGVYMVVHAWMNEGPEVTILFTTAEGLEAGKTRVNYRNVEMGLVTEVNLTDDLEKVQVSVQMKKQATPLLREDSRFWLVTARVGGGSISGLGTLLSGAYIELDPGSSGEFGRREFAALKNPPLTPADAPGLRLQLLSDRAGSVSVGNKVLHKGYEVGRVESVEFDAGAERVRYQVFIDAPFHELVDSSVRFWNSSGVAINANAEGVSLRTESIENVLLGGITFDRPPDMPVGTPVEANAIFDLYESHEASLENPFRFRELFVVRFTQSIKGLLPGAPVEYRGVRIGTVERVMLREMIESRNGLMSDFDSTSISGQAIPVLIHLEPGRLSMPDTAESLELIVRNINAGIKNGLRASLETGNLLTGKMYVGLNYYPDLPEVTEAERHPEQDYGYTTIPTFGGNFDQIIVKVNRILDKIGEVPLEETLHNANQAIDAFSNTLAGLDRLLNDEATRRLPTDVDRSLIQLRRTLDGLSPESELYQSMGASLRQLNRSLNNIEALTRTLAAQPNAIIVPSKAAADVEPEAR